MRTQRIPLRRDGEVRVPLLGGPSRAAAAAVVQGEARRCCSIGAWAFRTVVALALVAASAFMQAHGLIPHEQVDALQLELRVQQEMGQQHAQRALASRRLGKHEAEARALGEAEATELKAQLRQATGG